MDFLTTFIPSFLLLLEVACRFAVHFISPFILDKKIYLQNRSWFLHYEILFKIVPRICFWTGFICFLTVWVCPFYFCIFYVSHSFYWVTSCTLNPLISFTSNQDSLFSLLKGMAHHPNWFSFLILCSFLPICRPLISCTLTSSLHFLLKFWLYASIWMPPKSSASFPSLVLP